MDNETNGLADWFLMVRHTTDAVLQSQLLSRRENSTSHRPTGRVAENALPRPAFLPLCMSNCIVESLDSTNNSPLAEVQGTARATAKLHRVMEEKAKQERERVEREAREMVLASSRPLSGLSKKITRKITCENCGRQKYFSRSSVTNREFEKGASVDNPLPVLKQGAAETFPLVETGVLRVREVREQFESEIERKEREMREQRERKKQEREARELEEASRWPQQQEAINGPWCACRLEGDEAAQSSEQDFDVLREPQQETYPNMYWL